ncbi:phage tail protein [Pullulanibacillus sp. KACC 23026]|uniref:major tail protein n=1 Tax=Pullulanibacillus sp. KACC 23026 TaxID=3028315 RepID=UPI0023B098E1|nr:major tail protein [Pullulanibacillus sp. KACC 23026]WEG14155.1 phage tail protein [Pullulanibacillus sp. KACC 23026]
MATVGFDSAKIAILDENEQTSAENTFTIDGKSGGAVEANVTGLAPAQNIVWASNVPFRVLSKGTGDIKIALSLGDIESLPDGAVDKILGRTQNEQGITVVGADTQPPYCAVELITHDSLNNKLFFGLLKVQFTFDGDDIKTTDNNGPQASSDVLNGAGIARASDALSYVKARESDQVTQEVFETFIFPQAVPAA